MCVRDDGGHDDINKSSASEFSIKFHIFFFFLLSFVLIYFHCIWRWGRRRINGAMVVANDDDDMVKHNNVGHVAMCPIIIIVIIIMDGEFVFSEFIASVLRGDFQRPQRIDPFG